MTLRTCKVCGLTKPLEDYRWCEKRGVLYRRRTCAACDGEARRRRARARPRTERARLLDRWQKAKARMLRAKSLMDELAAKMNA